MGKLIDTDKVKIYNSEECSFIFDKKSGYTRLSGPLNQQGEETRDAIWCPAGPIIADIEISTICSGLGNGRCPHCYKTRENMEYKNMSLDTFKQVFSKLPKIVTQVAFGIGDIDSNGEMFDIFEYTRANGVIPNVTINGFGLSDAYAQKLKELCGAVAVSRYAQKDFCYDAVKKLTDLGMNQVNIHIVVSEQTESMCYETISDIKNDPRLAKLNAIVFLSLKPKGSENSYTALSQDKFKALSMKAMEEGISFGFDSCSANKFLEAVRDLPQYDVIKNFVEPCESTLFSAYVSVDGEFYPCSFCEGEPGWEKGLDLLGCNGFLEDVWCHERTNKFRDKLLGCNRSCPMFKV